MTSSGTSTPTTALAMAYECWVPSADRSWCLAESSYGPFESLRPRSDRHRRQGLVAEAGLDGRPRLCEVSATEAEDRGEALAAVRRLLVLPHHDGERCAAVVLIFLGNGPGAVEWWGPGAGAQDLRLLAGHHPAGAAFAEISRHIAFPYGSGLPGLAWERGSCQLGGDLAASPFFLRSSSAARDGYRSACAIPLVAGSELQGVALLLSAAERPWWRLAECWRPEDGRLHRIAWDGDKDLAAPGERLRPEPGQDLVGRAWAERRPVLCDGFTAERFHRAGAALAAGCSAALAWPVFVGPRLRSIALLIW